MPSARTIGIAGRGAVAVWDCPSDPESIGDPAGPSEPPTLLLHGWNVDARVNFDSALPALRRQRRVVMFDQHGHGLGVRSDECFDLQRCADDAVAVLDALEIDRAIVVGYSLGGSVAQLLALTHPDRCAGLVLAATADRFSETSGERAQFAALEAGARAMRRLPPGPRDTLFKRISAVACRRYPPWVLDTVRSADPVALLEAGSALGRFDSSSWSGALSTPCAVVVTSNDTVVNPARQRRLAGRVGATAVIEVAADHDLPIRNDPRFADALVAACSAVSHGLALVH